MRVWLENVSCRIAVNKANTSDPKASFLDLHLSILDGFASTKICNKHNYFDFDIVSFSFLDGDVPPHHFSWCLHPSTYSDIQLKTNV